MLKTTTLCLNVTDAISHWFARPRLGICHDKALVLQTSAQTTFRHSLKPMTVWIICNVIYHVRPWLSTFATSFLCLLFLLVKQNPNESRNWSSSYIYEYLNGILQERNCWYLLIDFIEYSWSKDKIFPLGRCGTIAVGPDIDAASCTGYWTNHTVQIYIQWVGKMLQLIVCVGFVWLL